MSAFSVAAPRAPVRASPCAPPRASPRAPRARSPPAPPRWTSPRNSPPTKSRWESVKSLVSELGMDEAQADTCMVRAFGWGAQSYWRESKVEEIPTFEDVEARLDFLVEIGVPEDKLKDLLAKVPEIIGCDLALLRSSWSTSRRTTSSNAKRGTSPTTCCGRRRRSGTTWTARGRASGSATGAGSGDARFYRRQRRTSLRVFRRKTFFEKQARGRFIGRGRALDDDDASQRQNEGLVTTP